MSKIESNYVISAETQNCFNLSNLTGGSISLETYNTPSAITSGLGKNQFGLNTIADSVINTITINGVTSGINLLGNVSIDTLNIFNHCNFFTNQQTTSINITSANITSATIKLVDHSCFGYFYAAER